MNYKALFYTFLAMLVLVLIGFGFFIFPIPALIMFVLIAIFGTFIGIYVIIDDIMKVGF